MRLKSKILLHQEPTFVIKIKNFCHSTDLFFEEKILFKNTISEEHISKKIISEGVVILNIQMQLSTPETIQVEISDESIIMNFICCKSVEPVINEMQSKEYTKEKSHNILYVSNYNAVFQIPAFEEINYFTIVLSLDYYQKLINENWSVHSEFSKKISQKKTCYLTPVYKPFNPAIQWVIHEIKNCKFRGIFKKMYLETKIKEILVLQLDSLLDKCQKKGGGIQEEDYNKLLKAKSILETNFTHAPTLPELSRLVSLNEFKLKKGFKFCFDSTIKGYVTKLRMEYAKKLFKNKVSNVGEVAYKCGYKDVSHFSAAFKLFYGFTPISFRKLV